MGSRPGKRIGSVSTCWQLSGLWAGQLAEEGSVLAGDNIAALQGAVSLRGKRSLTLITKDVSWRRSKHQWLVMVAHLPAEANVAADALSMLSAPDGARFPTAE